MIGGYQMQVLHNKLQETYGEINYLKECKNKYIDSTEYWTSQEFYDNEICQLEEAANAITSEIENYGGTV